MKSRRWSPWGPIAPLCVVLATTAGLAQARAAEAVGRMANLSCNGEPADRWSHQRAWEWYVGQPWLLGFNYVPSTACNTTEWWQAETFDPKTIDRELGWAADVGYNTTRAFIQYLVWKHDPDGFRRRFDEFLGLAARHGIRVMPVLFDDCAFGEPLQAEPYLGKQRDPIPGMILPSWTPSPGLSRVTDRAAWPDLEAYVKDLVGHFAQDERIVAWDLYNEPGNTGMGDRSRPLVEAAFRWARQAQPSQPLTVSVWNGTLGEMNRVLVEQSDVISFHAYTDYAGMVRQIDQYEQQLRPVICTEWMARPRGARFDTELPLFKRRGVGCFQWGLVAGRTQARFPWWNKPGGQVDPQFGWFHDIFHSDGKPYRPEEIDVIRCCAADKSLDWVKCYRPRPKEPPRRPGEINDADDVVEYSEDWTQVAVDGPRGGSLHYANKPGCGVKLRFRGSQVDLLYKQGPDCGIARVLIDGKPATPAEIDTYGPSVNWNAQVRLAEGLPTGEHVVEIEVTGSKHEKSTGAYVQVVGFDVK
jgi:hypothetical protein